VTNFYASGHLQGMPMSDAARRADRDSPLPSPSFRAVYDENFKRVWRSLRRLGVPPEALDDAIQDVFLAVHRRLESFEGRSALATWVMSIAVRVARDHRRRFQRKGGRLEPLTTTERDEKPGPHERAMLSEAVRLTYETTDDAVRQLS